MGNGLNNGRVNPLGPEFFNRVQQLAQQGLQQTNGANNSTQLHSTQRVDSAVKTGNSNQIRPADQGYDAQGLRTLGFA